MKRHRTRSQTASRSHDARISAPDHRGYGHAPSDDGHHDVGQELHASHRFNNAWGDPDDQEWRPERAEPE